MIVRLKYDGGVALDQKISDSKLVSLELITGAYPEESSWQLEVTLGMWNGIPRIEHVATRDFVRYEA